MQSWVEWIAKIHQNFVVDFYESLEKMTAQMLSHFQLILDPDMCNFYEIKYE